ncbi:MAG TPA: ABC transporter ATP-binding protein [Elusimicrobiota bacterium]|jgi:spermidine/putrescine transport system ATP-binding protein|nr:ABC transporter ATP-binding protein [Elusimicrobiota bacterium]
MIFPVEPLLDLQGLEKSFGGTQVLKGISLSVGQGEFLTLLGPSGCGKTTTLRIIAGFENPDRGQVLLAGKNVTRLAPYDRDIHTVFQHYALFPHYDVFGNVAFGLRLKKMKESDIKERVLSSLDLVRLKGLENRRPSQLSGGQMQRVALARALAGRPPLLLLDEPLGALDLKLRKEMQLELKHIQRRLGISFIYVTHDQEEAMTMSDRVAVFNAGRIEQIGAPQEIYENPKTAFVADFIGAANILCAEVVSSSGDSLRIKIEGSVEADIPAQNGWAQAAVKSAVQLALRPERVTVGADLGQAAENGWLHIKGALAETVYLGNSRQVILRTANGEKAIVSSMSAEAFAAMGADIGGAALAKFRTKDLVLLGSRERSA